MALDNSPKMRDDPPPSYEFGAEECVAAINAVQLSQHLQNLAEALNSILDASFEKEQFIESLEATLRRQPAAKHAQMFDIAQTIFNACQNVYKFEEDPSISWKLSHEEKHEQFGEKVLDANESGSEKDAIAAEVHIRHRQNISAKDQPMLREITHGFKPSQAKSSKKVPRSKLISLNAKPLPILDGRNTKRVSTPVAMSPMTCDTTSHESLSDISRLSSPESMGTPPRIRAALQEETPKQPKQPKGPEYEFRSLISQSIEEFIYHARQQIKQLALYEVPSVTYDAIFGSLDDEESENRSNQWSIGSEWLRLVESGKAERERETINYALTAMAFQKWHASQMRLSTNKTPQMTEQTASKLIIDRLVGPTQESNSIQRRKNIRTHLTRGKKWNQLVEQLGHGILLKKAW
ncbi:hypothetical protein M441DRAFT_133552 [Trichoderma asperellum CBS 433.97]|uniref:Uncharacterized protein n=1 Tax=Trichoderma asperellum (strain ATCC 204424 / CBS 433.97 / NBRC 101777) TaxID=1042311 RepID=A0A2T3ZG70_TRIA4|nr:hypothetical protein M441DRAFT_133552 [Trichoderma asperellum CBS 433.97]PTB43811.1 hypothetical protein M441DRAFT_133552 [Trichoderma asperellum CBS 433.97]